EGVAQFKTLGHGQDRPTEKNYIVIPAEKVTNNIVYDAIQLVAGNTVVRMSDEKPCRSIEYAVEERGFTKEEATAALKPWIAAGQAAALDAVKSAQAALN